MLARKFGLYFLLPLLILLIAAEATIYFVTADRLERQFDKNLRATRDAIDAAISARIGTIQSDLTVMRADSALAEFFQYKSFQRHDAAQRRLTALEDNFVEVAQIKPSCKAFRFFDRAGHVLINVVDRKRSYKAIDVGSAPWFRKTLGVAPGTACVSDVYDSEEHDAPTVTISTSIAFDEEIRGVFAIDISVVQLAEGLVAGDRLGEGGYAYLVGEDGRILAGDGPERADASATKSIFAGYEGTRSIDDGDSEMVRTAYRPQELTNVGLVVAVPHKQILAPVDEMRGTIIPLSVVGFLVIALVGILMLRQTVRPIKRLTEVTGRVAEGNLDLTIDVRTGDEIEELAQSFNRMTEGLRASRLDLEEAVRTAEKRAEELEHAYKALEGTQRKLVQAEKMGALGQLAGGIAHDFNNLLSGIMGAADLIKRRSPDEETRREYLDAILDTARRAADLIRQLLAFSRSGPTRSTAVDMHGIISEVIAILERTVDKRIRIEARLDAKEPIVAGDASQLQSAILNLGVNARDAMPEGGTLTFATVPVELDDHFSRHAAVEPGRYLEVSVADTGHGMAKEVADRIFEPFFTTKDVGAGTGLGLAAVYGTVQGHGGSVNVYSEPGHGTIFKLYLPLTRAGAADEPEEPPTDVIRGSGRILLADDEPVIRNLATDMLKWLGYDVVVASDGAEALERFREGPAFDLVVTDLVMPRMNGRELLHEVIRIDPTARVLVASGFHLDVEIETIRQEGAVGFLQKPYVIAELSRKVAGALRTATAPRGLRILVADDARLNRDVVATLLDELGHVATQVADGEAALAITMTERFDLLLLDIELPGIDGFEVAAAIREGEARSGGHLPIVAMTGHTSPEYRARCLAAGMDDFLSKPIAGEHLEGVLLRLFAGQRRMDWTKPLKALENREDLLRRVAATFVEEAPRLLDELSDALARGDAAAVHRAAHTLRGSMRYFDAEHASECAAIVERLARGGTLEGVAEAAMDLDTECRRLLPEIQEFAAATPGEEVESGS